MAMGGLWSWQKQFVVFAVDVAVLIAVVKTVAVDVAVDVAVVKTVCSLCC